MKLCRLFYCWELWKTVTSRVWCSIHGATFITFKCAYITRAKESDKRYKCLYNYIWQENSWKMWFKKEEKKRKEGFIAYKIMCISILLFRNTNIWLRLRCISKWSRCLLFHVYTDLSSSGTDTETHLLTGEHTDEKDWLRKKNIILTHSTFQYHMKTRK